MELDVGLRKVASALYCYLNTPRALACHIMLKYKEFGALAALAIVPAHYLEGSVGAEKFRKDAQATDFLRKSPLLPTKVNKRKVAVKTFDECERQCYQANQLLDLLRYPSIGESRGEERLRATLLKAQKKAKRILGCIPDELKGRFGPGTSFEMKGQAFSTFADKLWITPHATKAAMPLFEHGYWNTHWGSTRLSLGLPLPTQCRGNRFTTVKKDATKDRGICIEPLGNLWGQLAVGGVMKRKLAAVGLRVDRTSLTGGPLQRLQVNPPLDGKTIHMRLAREGSRSGRWATIDLSNASDTVSLELVRWVLPEDWFELLYALRSPFTYINGRWVRLDKFSSMGNGYTFELETLVFACILSAAFDLVIGRDLYVYGDDIVLPTEHGRDALAVLQMCGLTPNMRKSYVSGPFRESCGGDYFSGFDVRSYYADGEFTSPLEWIALHNQLKAKWPRATLVHKRAIDQVPLALRQFGPSWLGDRVLHGAVTRSWWRDGSQWIGTVEMQPLRIPLERWGSEFTLTLALLGVSSNGITPRVNGEDAPDGFLVSETSIS